MKKANSNRRYMDKLNCFERKGGCRDGLFVKNTQKNMQNSVFFAQVVILQFNECSVYNVSR